MTARWSAPVLAVGLAALAAGTPALGGYFGATNYSANSPPTCCAQTHFVTACEDSGIQTVGYATETVLRPSTKTIYVDEIQTTYKTITDTVYRQVQETISHPYTETVMKAVPETVTRTVYETVPRPVTETVCQPVCETVMKECRSTVHEKVRETRYKEYTVNSCKRVCEPITENQCIQVCKPVCETIYRDCSRTVCKPVTETHYRDCPQTICTPVTETVLRETCRLVTRDVTETVCQDVCKTVSETVTCPRTVTRTVPETVFETVCVPGHLTWQCVPKYDCVFDPCTCTTVQKQVGTTRKLVREPSHTVTRQVTRDRTAIEQVQETKVIQKQIVEKVPTTVTKKVSSVVYEKVPVTVTRNVTTTQIVKVPYTVTKTVPSVEVTRVPTTVHRRVLGAYVDTASLTGEASANAAKGGEFVTGGPTAIGNPNAATYEAGGPGRVFVEGLRATRSITRYVAKTVPVTEVRKVPYQVTTTVPREIVKQVPTTITKMVPTTITKMVPVATCRIVTEEVVKMVPTQVTTMRLRSGHQMPTRGGYPAGAVYNQGEGGQDCYRNGYDNRVQADSNSVRARMRHTEQRGQWMWIALWLFDIQRMAARIVQQSVPFAPGSGFLQSGVVEPRDLHFVSAGPLWPMRCHPECRSSCPATENATFKPTDDPAFDYTRVMARDLQLAQARGVPTPGFSICVNLLPFGNLTIQGMSGGKSPVGSDSFP